MFVVLLKFSNNKSEAGRFMDGHNAWIRSGFEEDVFLLTGGIAPKLGGGILAHNTTLADLQARLNADPFVAEDVVSAEIIEIRPARTDARLAFLQVAA
jgi:uncharacterized protein YciI